jgi:hypothetical protein
VGRIKDEIRGKCVLLYGSVVFVGSVNNIFVSKWPVLKGVGANPSIFGGPCEIMVADPRAWLSSPPADP